MREESTGKSQGASSVASLEIGVDRRSLLKGLAGALALPVVVGMTQEQVLALGLGAHRQSAQPAGTATQEAGLSSGEVQLLEVLTEALLPRTETPGARDARVVPFIDAMVRNWFPDDARTRYRQELSRVDGRCRELYDAPIEGTSDEQRQQLLALEEQEAFAARNGKSFNPGPGSLSTATFYDVTKWLTVYGYFTSEAVLEGVLEYRHFYSRYRGDVPVSA